MTSGFFQLIKRAFSPEPAIHPVEQKMARHWIKQRLVAVFPELRNNPAALDAAYRGLNLEPRAGEEGGGSETIFEITLPGRL